LPDRPTTVTGPVGGRAKRATDLALAVPLAFATAPVMAAIAAWVRRDSPGPALYRQRRIGYAGKPFTLLKFRTMVVGAEGMGAGLAVRDGDDRITRAGHLLRRLSLDELPQLWNVIRGDMSFVGPRPERPFFVAELARDIPFYQQRHAVKPGLTGWAQVKYRYGASREDAMEKLRYDLYYIKHLSVFFDLTIVFDTVKVVLFRKGAA
jgi:lipopolysaccharide/colanic/teichoic acid biosynthesis glycosyltransferase